MPYQHSHLNAATGLMPPMDADELDALLIDDEDDDFLDRHLADIRETLADLHSF
jgi:hypothetical protein